MAITISNVYIQTFERIVRHLAQQGDTKLRQFVTEVATNGEKHNWERVGATDPTKKTSARTPTPTADLAWSRRVSLAQTFHACVPRAIEFLLDFLLGHPGFTFLLDVLGEDDVTTIGVIGVVHS